MKGLPFQEGTSSRRTSSSSRVELALVQRLPARVTGLQLLLRLQLAGCLQPSGASALTLHMVALALGVGLAGKTVHVMRLQESRAGADRRVGQEQAGGMGGIACLWCKLCMYM